MADKYGKTISNTHENTDEKSATSTSHDLERKSDDKHRGNTVVNVDRAPGYVSSNKKTSVFSRFLKRIELEPEAGTFAPGRWSNKGELTNRQERKPADD